MSESSDEKIINLSGMTQKCINESIKKPIPTKIPHRLTFGTPYALKIGDAGYSFGKRTITEKIELSNDENYQSKSAEEINYS